MDTVPVCGLSDAEARERLEQWGPNAMPPPELPSPARRLARQLRNPLVGLLALAALLSLALGEFVDAAIILVVVVANAVLGALEEGRADNAAEALRGMLRPRAVAERDGDLVELDAADLVPGDLVVLHAGDRVPADACIADASALEMDESMLTGESLPVARTEGELLAGTTVARGVARAIVTATGQRTELGSIVESASRSRPITPLERRLGQLAGILLRAGGAVCAALAVIAWAYGESPADAAMTGVALAVAAMPEGLPAVVAITLALGVRLMARHGAIVRRLDAVETLGSTTVICADKTGTLTGNRMEVVRVLDRDGREALLPADAGALAETFCEVLVTAALASEASLPAGPDAPGVDPTEAAIFRVVRDRCQDDGAVVVALEPFDSERRCVRAVVEWPDGERSTCLKGSPEHLAQDLADGSATALPTATAARWGAEGMRVLMVARQDAGERLTSVGLLALSDPPRPAVAQQIARAREAGVRTVMVTGDHPETALAVARQVGIARPQTSPLIGAELAALPDAELQARMRESDVVARVRPEQKVRIVEALHADGEVVAMTGDGINDVPALRAADIGVAMGERGTDAAAEAADMVLVDDDYSTIVRAIERGRVTYENVVRATHFLLAANLGEVIVFAAAVPLGLGAPLAVLQILLMNLLTDGLPAVALSADPAEPGIMQRPPRPARENLLAPILSRLLTAGLLTGACGFVAFLIGRGASGHETGQTMAFVTLVAAQLVYVFSVRGWAPLWRCPSNRALTIAVIGSALVGVAVVAAPGLRGVFDMAALSWPELAAALALAVPPVVVTELVKHRAYDDRRSSAQSR